VTHGQQLLGICLEGCLHKPIAFYNPTMMKMMMMMVVVIVMNE
jgi:hypothetical protein